MANKQTGIGLMFRQDPRAAADELREVAERCGGCVVVMARDLMISRRQLYRLLDRAKLWPEVDAAREAVRSPEA